MEIFLDKRALKHIRQSTADAIEDGDNETLREDVMEAFSEDQIEEIERRIDSGDFHDFLTEVLDEWSGDDVEELLELLEAHLADVGIEVKHKAGDHDDDTPEEVEEEEEEDAADDDVDDADLDDGDDVEGVEEEDEEI